jgi:hypothetical protein
MAELPYLIVGLNASHQDGQVLNSEVHVIVYMLVDALIGWPGISERRNRGGEMTPPNFATPCPASTSQAVLYSPKPH